MTKTTTSSIIAQKLDHILYFQQDGVNESLLIGIARDACYTANNGLSFKKKQLADILAEYDRHMSEKDDNAAERAERFAGKLYAELGILEERFDIEKAVYSQITGGEEWTPTIKRPVKRTNVDMEALRKKVA